MDIKITSHPSRNATSLELGGARLVVLDELLRFLDISTMRAAMDEDEYEQAMTLVNGIHAAVEAKYIR